MPKQSEAQLGEKKLRIVRAAASVFVRYGYARTTIGDVAKAAVTHRSAVYGIFPGGKEELFEAYLLVRVKEAIESYREKIATLATVREKLLFCALDWCTESFVLAEMHPDASDSYDICYPAVRRMYSVLASFYAEFFREAADHSALGISAENLAELFVFSLRGVRRIPETLDDLRIVVARQVDIFLAAVDDRA